MVQHPPKAHFGLPTTCWLIPSSFDERSCSHIGQRPCSTNSGQSNHDIRSITPTDCAIYSTAAAPSPIQLQAKHAPRITPLYCACTLPKNRPNTEYVFQSPVKQQHQPRTHTVDTPPRRLTASCGFVRRYQRSTQKLRADKQRKTRKSTTQNIEPLHKSQRDHNRNP